MKLTDLNIEVKSLDKALEEFSDTFKNLQEDRSVEPKIAIYFSNLKSFRQAISQKRIEMLRVIKQKHPSSIYELAKILKRDFKNVSDDINLLSNLGIVQIEINRTNKQRNKPTAIYDKIVMEIAL